MADHFTDMIARHPALAICQPEIERAFARMADCYRQGNKMLLCGNGGSAADADHWAGELLKGFRLKRPLPPEQKAGLSDDLAAALQQPLPAIPLTGFQAASTAFANDVNPDYIFAQLTLGLGKPGDVLVGLSTSGNARNVCHAMEVGRAQGLTTIALTGQGGGRLAELADITIRVPETETSFVQELHLPVYHCLCLMLEDEFFQA